MRDIGRWLTALCVAALCLALAAPASAQPRFAAVVGVEDYPDAIGAAPGAAADAELISDALRRQGFNVVTEIDADQAAIKRAVFWLNDQLAAAGSDATGVFYFVGHGLRLDGRTFLVATDTRVNDALAASGSAIDAEFIIQRLDASAAARSFLIIDASGPNGLIDRFKLEPGLSAIDPPASGMVVLSNYPGRLAPARQAGVSSFATAVAELIGADTRRFSTAIQNLRDAVTQKSNGARYAWTAGRVAEDFSFHVASAADDFAPAAAQPEPLVAAATPSPAPPPTAPAPSAAIAEGEQAHLVDVFFGTDREVRMNGGTPTFLADPAPLLTYGMATVSIPPRHETGELESPRWWRFEFTPDERKHIVFRGAALRSEDAFFEDVRRVIDASEEKQAFVFIHGFNNDFETAARRTAQLHHDLRFDGAPIFYSWSSRGEGTPLAYNRDATAVDRTAPKLERFLTLVAERTGAERIHLIGHSLGARALMQALDRMAQNLPDDAPAPFNEIILSAPDIDKAVFQDLAERMEPAGERVTMYASRNDQALKASRSWNGFPRAGDTADGVMVLDDLETIDASGVRTELFGGGHDYFASDRSILDDLRALLATGAEPDVRGLELRLLPPDDGRYWIIR